MNLAPSDVILELNTKNLKKGLLQYNYFPRTHDQKEEMPPIFNSESLNSSVAGKICAIGLSEYRKNSGFDVMPFKRTRHPNIPRILGIPHPKAYVELVNSIVGNWEEHLKNVCQSENSNLKFEVQSDFRIIVHKYNSISVDAGEENKDHALDFGSSYRIRTDITNFYHSIYSHSLPWALVGHSDAKKKKNDKSWFNNLDRDVRRCQRNETKGIAIGPATSSILSEIILFPIDKTLREKGYKFSRYIDDYTAFTKTKSDADEFLVELSKELDKYALSLNPRKTAITEMPVQNTEKWVIEMNQVLALTSFGAKNEEGEGKLNYRQLRLVLDKAISLSAEYPDGSVIKYAISSILEVGVSGDDAEKHLQDSLLKYAFYYPSLIPLIYKWSRNFNSQFETHSRLVHLFEHSLKQGQSDNAVWCIYYLMGSMGHIDLNILIEACKDESPMVMLMGYIYAKIRNKPVDYIVNWANEKAKLLKEGKIEEYDIDRYWLVFYQLFSDGEIAAPPYTAGQDIAIFEILKKEGVSFVDYQHPDLKNPIEKLFGKLLIQHNTNLPDS